MKNERGNEEEEERKTLLSETIKIEREKQTLFLRPLLRLRPFMLIAYLGRSPSKVFLFLFQNKFSLLRTQLPAAFDVYFSLLPFRARQDISRRKFLFASPCSCQY